MDVGSSSQKYFDKAKALAESGQYEYAIEMYLLGLARDPENIDAHKDLRSAAQAGVAAKAIKPTGMLAAMKLKKLGDDLQQNVTNAEKLLATDPKNTGYMELLFKAAALAGHRDTALWIGPMLMRARMNDDKQSADHFLTIKDVYCKIKEFELATDALQRATALRPDDLTLRDELNRISTELAIKKGNYSRKGTFTANLKNAGQQAEVHAAETDMKDKAAVAAAVEKLRQDYRENPEDANRLVKLVEFLLKAGEGNMRFQNEAISVLEAAHTRTGQYKYKHQAEDIQLRQLRKFERLLKMSADAEPGNEAAQKEYKDQVAERQASELAHVEGSIQHYPTDMKLKMEAGRLMFEMGQYDKAIPMLQQAQTDGKYRGEAKLLLGRSFLEAEFVEEAVATLAGLVEQHGATGDEKAKDIYYWYGRSLEENDQLDDATKAYSQIAQWDFGYADVQTRIKELRARKKAAG